MARASWGERWKAFREASWGLALIVIVVGGIYSGMFTPTEAAAIAAVYSFAISVFVYKDMKIMQVPAVLRNAAAMSSMLLYIITNAVLFSFLLTSEQIPQAMAAWMTHQGFGVIVFLFLVNIILLVAGNFMDPSAIVLIMAPILYPMAVQAGRQPDPHGHPDGRQHGGGHVPPAGGAEPVRGLGHHEDGHLRAHGGGAGRGC